MGNSGRKLLITSENLDAATLEDSLKAAVNLCVSHDAYGVREEDLERARQR